MPEGKKKYTSGGDTFYLSEDDLNFGKEKGGQLVSEHNFVPPVGNFNVPKDYSLSDLVNKKSPVQNVPTQQSSTLINQLLNPKSLVDYSQVQNQNPALQTVDPLGYFKQPDRSLVNSLSPDVQQYMRANIQGIEPVPKTPSPERYPELAKYNEQLTQPVKGLIKNVTNFTDNPVAQTISGITNAVSIPIATVATGFSILSDVAKLIPEVKISKNISLGGKELSNALNLPFEMLGLAPKVIGEGLDKSGVIPSNRDISNALGISKKKLDEITSSMQNANSLFATITGLGIAHSVMGKTLGKGITLDESMSLGKRALEEVNKKYQNEKENISKENIAIDKQVRESLNPNNAQLKSEVTNASRKQSTEPVSKLEVRSQVGEKAPLRQQPEVPAGKNESGTQTPKGEEVKNIVESNGARYEGIQKDNVLFTNKKTGGTFSLPKDEITPENVKAKLAQDKNPPIEKLPPKATQEELTKAVQKQDLIKPLEPQRKALEKQLGTKLEDLSDTELKNLAKKSENKIETQPNTNTGKTQRVMSLKPLKGEGETKVRGASKRFADAISTDVNADLPIYNVKQNAPQIKAISEIASQDPNRVVRMYLGQEKIPNGILPGIVHSAVKQLAREGKVPPEMLNQLANSDFLSKQGTTAGQVAQSFGVKDPLDPINALKEVQKVRTDEFMKKSKGRDITKLENRIVDQIAKSTKKNNLKFNDWKSFIQSIECK